MMKKLLQVALVAPLRNPLIDNPLRRRGMRVAIGALVSAMGVFQTAVAHAQQNWEFWNTGWTSMSIGAMWGNVYLCGSRSNNQNFATNLNSVYCVTSTVGGEIVLGQATSTNNVPGGIASPPTALGGTGGLTSVQLVNEIPNAGPIKYFVAVINQSNHLVIGTLPTQAPVNDAVGNIDDATVSWSDVGGVPGGGAVLDMAGSEFFDAAFVYIVGQNNAVYSYNIDTGKWADTTGRYVVSIGWSPSKSELWAVCNSGAPFEGYPRSDGTVSFTFRSLSGFGSPPWCGLTPTSSSPYCVLSVGGNAAVLWDTVANPGPEDAVLQWSGGSWGVVGQPTDLLLPDLNGSRTGPPGVLKILEGGYGPIVGPASDLFWVLTYNQRILSWQQDCCGNTN